MCVIEKNGEIGSISRSEDVGKSVADCIGEGNFDEHDRIGDQYEDDVEDEGTTRGLTADVEYKQKSDISDCQFCNCIEL